MRKYVYLFSEGNKDMKNLLGGKGANLAEMMNMKINVPQGFTVTTEACNLYYQENKTLNKNIQKQIKQKIKKIESLTHKNFGSTKNPLLLSVRSGARASMPGMMDTILNLGLNDDVASSFAQATNNPRFVYDSYRRLIMMYADVVKGLDKSVFEQFLTKYKDQKNVAGDLDLTSDDMLLITREFKNIYYQNLKEEFPQDPYEQLYNAVSAVFESWNNDRAIYYRKMNNIPNSWGTAVNVQEMVYGNIGKNSGTGVAFSRNPATGENEVYGEYLINAQGEDVVAGIRTPQPIAKLKEELPKIYEEFTKIAKRLEKHYKDMQDMEFTIENGRLYMLQTRNGKRTATAALKVAVDMVQEGLITKEQALLNIDPNIIDQLLHPVFDKNVLATKKVIAQGLAASPGAASGKIYFNADDCIKASKNGEKTVLVRLETSPEDIEGVSFAQGILTIHGGMTSHAAVVARGMGKCCVSGASELLIDEQNKVLKSSDKEFKQGDYISLDGSTGKIYEGQIPYQENQKSKEFITLMKWADEVSTMKVRANAETVKDAKNALEFGAKGIGLCRTEHMFFASERIFHLRQMILAQNTEQRNKALKKLIAYQIKDMEDLFRIMSPNPVVIRYLDPPLHEFLPKTKEEKKQLAESLNLSLKEVEQRCDELKEFNPMMGHRGCRLDITYPEIAKMQTTAVITAAINVKREGYNVHPEIMIPLVVDVNELKYVKEIIETTAQEVMQQLNCSVKYLIGTMIESPRACLISQDLAKNAEFFSFGTNDLTQLTYGFSRDDSAKFLNDYYVKNILLKDPFVSIDTEGVGKLMKLAIQNAKKANPNIELGICGEHAAEKESINFCNQLNLDYISCSPYRIYNARLAVAQAAIKNGRNL